jgi:hypothetical protein
MDDKELELAKLAASAFGRMGGKAKAKIPGAMSEMGKLSWEKRGAEPEERKRLGKIGRIGGAARAAASTPEQRSEIARRAVAARAAKRLANKQATLDNQEANDL